MKIAFLSFYSGHIYRGVETYVDHLATHLSEFHQIDLYQSGPASRNKSFNTIVKPVDLPQAWPNDTLIDVLFKRLFFDYYKRKELSFFFKSLIPLIKGNYDFICPLNSGWTIPILKLFTLFTKTKLILVGQSGPGWDDRWNLFWHPDVFVCLTKAQLSWAKKVTIWKNQNFTIIPNGVDLNQFSPNGPKIKIELQRPITMIAAALQTSKRVEDTINAVSQLNEGSLLLLGKGPLDKEVDKLGQKLLGKNRFLHTQTSHEEIPKFYRSSDLFTLCSESSEAFGIVYIEALATGLPVVATNDQSRKEILGNAAVYVDDPKNPLEYSQAIKTALRKNWKNMPLKQAQKFSWDKITSKYHHLFSTFK